MVSTFCWVGKEGISMVDVSKLKNFNDCMDCVKENHNLSYEEVVSPILDMLKEKCIESGLNPSENDRYLEMEYNLQYHHLIYNLLLDKDFTNTDEVVSELNKRDMEYGCNPYYLVKPHSNYGLKQKPMEIEVWGFLTQTTPNKKYKWYQPFVGLERKEFQW